MAVGIGNVKKPNSYTGQKQEETNTTNPPVANEVKDATTSVANTSTGGIYGDILTPVESGNPNNSTQSPNPVPEKEILASYSGETVGRQLESVTPTEEKSIMTYEEYIAEQKAREEEKRQAALKEAEIYKERAAADAQASYMQNMSTYGVNAENMAKMGLTGGGYSDYLNAQAYAQKRSDMQNANVNELALKQQTQTTYADNILSLDGQLLSYQESEKAEKEQYAKSVYNTLWEAVQNPDTNYTADNIKEIAEKAGLSEEDTATLTDMFNTTQTKKLDDEKAAQEETLYGVFDNIATIPNKEAAKDYLISQGYEKGSEEYEAAMEHWNNTFTSSFATEENKALAVQANIAAIPSVYNVAVTTDKYFDPKKCTAQDIMDKENIKKDKNIQKRSLDNLLFDSTTWGSDKNGTLVDVNYSDGSQVYVFYNGVWYRCSKKKKEFRNAGYKVLDLEGSEYDAA